MSMLSYNEYLALLSTVVILVTLLATFVIYKLKTPTMPKKAAGIWVGAVLLLVLGELFIWLGFVLDARGGFYSAEYSNRIVFSTFLGGGCLLGGISCLVNFLLYPTLKSRIEIAEKALAKGRYIKAGRHFRRAAQIYEGMDAFISAETSYRKAAKSYHASKDYEAFCYFLKHRIMRAKIEPWVKIEILEESANKLLEAGAPKKAVKLIKIIRAICNALQNVEKAKHYHQLAIQVKYGLTKLNL